MFFRNRKPVIITVDDYFPGVNSKHAYVKIGNSNPVVKEIWPMIIEKALLISINQEFSVNLRE